MKNLRKFSEIVLFFFKDTGWSMVTLRETASAIDIVLVNFLSFSGQDLLTNTSERQPWDMYCFQQALTTESVEKRS